MLFNITLVRDLSWKFKDFSFDILRDRSFGLTGPHQSCVEGINTHKQETSLVWCRKFGDYSPQPTIVHNMYTLIGDFVTGISTSVTEQEETA
jgi:hypothetical protein